MLNIKLIGAFGERNFGDDLLLSVMVKLVGRAVPLRRLGITATQPRSSGYIKRIAPRADVVERAYPMPGLWHAEIFAGGNQFYSFPQRNRELQQHGLLAKVRARIRAEGVTRFTVRHLLRHLLPKPRGYAVGIGIGPFESGNEDDSRRVVSALDQIWIRDERSKADLARWGLTNYAEGADLCFSSSALDVPRCEFRPSVRSVGVVVRGWDYHTSAANYMHAVLAFAHELRRGGFEVRFYAFCEPADQEVIALLEREGEPLSVWNPDRTTVSAFLSALGSHDLILSARFHGVVSAALLGIPTIGLAVDPKVRGICARLGVGEFVWDGNFSLRELRKTFDSAMPHLRSMRARMDLAVETERAKADVMMAGLNRRLRALAAGA